jgi:hypothetical protein
MCGRHVRSNTQQGQKLGIVPSPMPCIAGRCLRLRNALYFYNALIFGYFLIKQKVRGRECIQINNTNQKVNSNSFSVKL